MMRLIRFFLSIGSLAWVALACFVRSRMDAASRGQRRRETGISIRDEPSPLHVLAPRLLGSGSTVQSQPVSLFTCATEYLYVMFVLCWDLHRCERMLQKSSGHRTLEGTRSKTFPRFSN